MAAPPAGSPPFSAPEYRWPGTATIPRLQAALEPFTVTDDDFELTAPLDSSWYSWWPQEHFAHPDGMILPLAHQQVVQLRRTNHSRVLIATELRGEGKVHPLDTVPKACRCVRNCIAPLRPTLSSVSPYTRRDSVNRLRWQQM